MAEQNQWPESMADCKFYEQVGLAALLYSLGWQGRQSKNHRAFLESKRFRAFEILGSDDGFCIHGNWNFDEFLDQANTR